MSKYIMLILNVLYLYSWSYGQNTYTLQGSIYDERRQPIAGAVIYLPTVAKGASTDGNGGYILKGIRAGRYPVAVSFVGCRTVADTITVEGNTVFSATLAPLSLAISEITVTDNQAGNRKKSEPLNIEIVTDEYLKQNLGGSIMGSLDRLPGISTIAIGSGQSKPVIRGLGFNRVAVVENNIKHEAQQWGADHGLEIDQYAVDNVEIIKGPASLMYGSDALGGVIDMKSQKIHADSTYGGTLDITGKTNNDFAGSSLALYGRKNSFFAVLRATLLRYGDYRVPADSVDIYSYRAPLYKHHLRNTAGNEQNLHLSFGLIKPKLQSRFYISNNYSKNGFFANAHGLEPRNVDAALHDKSSRDIHYPYQTVSHSKFSNTSRYDWGRLQLQTDIGAQYNFRQEWSRYVSHGYMPAQFPVSMDCDPDLELQLRKYVYSANAKLSRQINNRADIIAGISSDYQDNTIGGRGFIIPAYTQLCAGAYLLGKYALTERSLCQAGMRYDAGTISTSEYYDWYASPAVNNADTALQFLRRADGTNRRFANLSWSLGYNYNAEQWSYKVNAGKSFRMPIAKELAANGVNYHNFSYEVGNSGISPEISYQLDAGIDFHTDKFSSGISPFVNYFTNYIYLNPSAEHDRLYGNGNQVSYYTQCEVLRYGGETSAQYQLLEPLQIGITGEYVYSVQRSGTKKGFTLPFAPPASAIVNVRYIKKTFLSVHNAYLTCDYKLCAAQNNIVPPEQATKGFQVINMGLGGAMLWRDQKVSISLQCQNLLDTKYFNHTSYYRLINVPEPGRNFIINISIPFSGKIKQK